MKLPFIIRLLPLLLITAAACSTHPTLPPEPVLPPALPGFGDTITVDFRFEGLQQRSIYTAFHYYSSPPDQPSSIEYDTTIHSTPFTFKEEAPKYMWSIRRFGGTATYTLKRKAPASYPASTVEIVLDTVHSIMLSAAIYREGMEIDDGYPFEQSGNYDRITAIERVVNLPYIIAPDGVLKAGTEGTAAAGSVTDYYLSTRDKMYEWSRSTGHAHERRTVLVDVLPDASITVMMR